MTIRSRALAERVAQTYPYQITCTSCDTRLIAVDRDWIVLLGRRPIEFIAHPDGDAHIACHRCGNMVLIDQDLLSFG